MNPTSCSPLTFHFLPRPKKSRREKKTERKKAGEVGGRGGEARRVGVEVGGVKRGEEKWGAGELLLLLSPYLLSLSPSFFSFCLSQGELGGQRFATSRLFLLHLSRLPEPLFSLLKPSRPRRGGVPAPSGCFSFLVFICLLRHRSGVE